MDPCGSFYASAAQGMPSLSSLPPSFHERPFLYPPGYSQQNPPIIDNGAGKLDEILSLLKKQQEEITDLKKEMASMKESMSQSRKRPRRVAVPNALSKLVKDIHESFEDRSQFDGSKLYSDKHNERILKTIQEEILACKEEYEPHVVRSVYRYFESRRRLWNDSKPDRALQVKKNKANSSRKALQRQLYQRRKKCLKDSEKSLWAEIDASFMSEESTHETDDGPAVHKHSPTFRSDRLNNFIKKLDRRHESKLRNKKGPLFRGHPRVIRSPLKNPKNGVPKWALVDPSPPSIPVASSTSICTSSLSQSTPTCPQHAGTSSQQMLSFSAGSNINYFSDSSSSDFELPE